MDEALRVDRGQGPQHGNHHIQGFLHAYFPARICNIGLEGNALDVVHDKVGGVIFIEEIRHPRDSRLAHEFCQGAGLLVEALRPVGKVVVPGGGHDRNRCPDTGGKLAGHVLLHRHTGRKLLVPGQVGDAKAALAQHPAHDIAAI